MFKSLAILALGVAIGGCATQQTAASADAAQSPEAKAQTHRVCQMIEDDSTGTKIGRRQECHDVVEDKDTEPKTN